MTPSTVPGPTGVRVATLRLRRVDPWSAMKTGFVFALGLGLMYVVAALLLFLFASATGVFESFNSTFSELSGTDGPFTFGIVGVLTVSLVFAVIEVIVTTLLIAVLALLYNASASVTGGVMVKLAED
ncbi:MAG: DUF3566 domain-containing protein [Candidatus Nanopelagicales bacterium]